MKVGIFLSVILSMMCIALTSCDKDNDIINSVTDPETGTDPGTESDRMPDTEWDPGKEHTYEVSIPPEGLYLVEVLRICLNTRMWVPYEITLEEECDWMIVMNVPEPPLPDDMPLVTILPNDTGQTRSVKISVKCTILGSEEGDTHLLVQESL